jgi:hypothetical protein
MFIITSCLVHANYHQSYSDIVTCIAIASFSFPLVNEMASYWFLLINSWYFRMQWKVLRDNIKAIDEAVKENA